MLATIPDYYTCLSCGDPLPPHRGGHCDTCVGTSFDPEPFPPPLPGDIPPPGGDDVPGPARAFVNPDDDHPPPGPDPEPGYDDQNRQAALWLLARGIDACTICGGAHRPTQCPKVAERARAERAGSGAAIARHWHTRPQNFYRNLASYDRSIWPVLAIPCALYHGWTVRRVLDAWTKGVDGDIHLPANAREAA